MPARCGRPSWDCSVALVERDLLGGTCLHRGCIPTKALLHAAEVADAARGGGPVRGPGDLRVDRHARGQRLPRGVVGTAAQGAAGAGRAPAGSSTSRARVGSSTPAPSSSATAASSAGTSSSPPAPTPAPCPAWSWRSGHDERRALRLDEVPGRVVVLGGGVIGVEFASVFRSFGSEVTVVEALPRLVAAEEPASSRRSSAPSASGASPPAPASGSPRRRSPATRSPSASRRARSSRPTCSSSPSVADRPPPAWASRRSAWRWTAASSPPTSGCAPPLGVFAVGDIVPGLQLAHRGFAQGIFVAEDVGGPRPRRRRRGRHPARHLLRPGGRLRGAHRGGGHASATATPPCIYEYNLGGNGKSQILGTQGFVKLVAARTTARSSGSTWSARGWASRSARPSWSSAGRPTPRTSPPLVHAHPTQNEALGEAHLALAGKPPPRAQLE